MASGSMKRNVVPWNNMRNRWVRCASKIDKTEDVKRYFNTFATNHPGYKFIVAKKFNDLYDVCITYEQYREIKNRLEREFGLEGWLDEANSVEVSRSDCNERSFRNTHEFREFRERGLSSLNRPVIKKKHEEATQHYMEVEGVFTTRRSEAFQILCFDIEVYEHNHNIMLEIGYVICRFTSARHYSGRSNKPNAALVTTRHLIIRDNRRYKNGDKVPDNRSGFVFGSSESLSMRGAVESFRNDVSECDYILGHSVKHDDAYLQNIGVDLRKLGKPMFDTQIVQTYKESQKESEKYFMRGLLHLLKEYQVNYQESHLHNAGCDAFYTMMVFLRQMGYSTDKVNGIIMDALHE